MELRSRTKLGQNNNNENEKVPEKKKDPNNGGDEFKMSYVVFIGLLLDLLAFTLILPLFPSLLDHPGIPHESQANRYYCMIDIRLVVGFCLIHPSPRSF